MADSTAQPYVPGDRDDFDRLYRSCYPRLLRTLTAVLGDQSAAEDCVQDAFIKAFRAWPRWRPEAPAEAWLHRIAVNTALSYRRRQRLRFFGALTDRVLARSSDQPDHAALLGDLGRALRTLRFRDAVIVVLYHYHGYPTSQIAVAVGMTERNVRLRLHVAHEALLRALGPSAEDLIDPEASISPSPVRSYEQR